MHGTGIETHSSEIFYQVPMALHPQPCMSGRYNKRRTKGRARRTAAWGVNQ